MGERARRGIVGLAGVSMGARSGRDIDDATLGGLAPLVQLLLGSFPHDWRSGLDEAERCCAVHCQHGVPLLGGDPVDHAVPCKACTDGFASGLQFCWAEQVHHTRVPLYFHPPETSPEG